MALKGRNYEIRNRPYIIERLLDNCRLNEETGIVDFNGIKAYIRIRFEFGADTFTVGYHQLVWLIKHKRWPLDGLVVDHINDIPYDNRPSNLQELTVTANQNKKRGKYRNHRYGIGEYGHGIYLTYDKSPSDARRGKKYNVYRTRHRLEDHRHAGKKVRLSRFTTKQEAEIFIKEYIDNGLRKPSVDILDEILGVEE